MLFSFLLIKKRIFLQLSSTVSDFYFNKIKREKERQKKKEEEGRKRKREGGERENILYTYLDFIDL